MINTVLLVLGFGLYSLALFSVANTVRNLSVHIVHQAQQLAALERRIGDVLALTTRIEARPSK